MATLIVGLMLFFSVHSLRFVSDELRDGLIARWGLNGFRAAHSVLSLLGLALIVWGFGMVRHNTVMLWPAMAWTRHAAALLMLLSFIFLAAVMVPGNAMKAKLHHPLILAAKVWAVAHLLANHSLADLLLFGTFLLWSVLAFGSARQRDRSAQTVYAPGQTVPTLLTVVLGVASYFVFAFWLHAMLMGVAPFA